MFNRFGKNVEILDMPMIDRVKHVDNEDVTLALYESFVRVNSDSSTVTITLPDAGEATGTIFDITVVSSTTNDVTVNDDTGTEVPTNTLSATDDFVLVMSNGYEWRILAEQNSA